MATATERKKRRMSRRSRSRGASRKESAPKHVAPRRRRSRWLWLLTAVALLAVFVWLLPTIVANSPLLNPILASAAADLKGKVTARSATLGWFSSLKLSGIEIRDEEGQPLLEIPEIRGDRSLLAILWDSSNLGRIRLEKPKLSVVLREDGSNVEDVLATYLAPSDEPWAAMDVGVEIVDGEVSVSNPRTQQSWRIEGLQLTLGIPADKTRPIELQTSGTVADLRRPGRFSVELRMHQGPGSDQTSDGTTADSPASDNEPAMSDELAIKTEAVPLAMFKSLFDRLALEMQLAGYLSSDIQCQWNGAAAPDTMVIEGSATAEDLAVSAPSLGSDQVEVGLLEATCRVAWRGDSVEVGQLAVQSDVGNASLVGTFNFDENTAGSILRRFPTQTFEMGGRVDLARLAAMLPDTLRIREGTRVTSGELQVGLASRRGPEGMSWQGRVEASNLAGVNQGRRLVWQQPILVTLAARESVQGPIVESLRCDSDFLKLHAAGTPAELTASASFDLNRLASQLGGFVDLGGLRLAGDGWAQLNWQRSDARDFQADGELQVRNFELTPADRPSWKEERLIVTLSATGRTDFSTDTQVDTATLNLDAGSERFSARLVQPVLDFRGGGVWPVEVNSTGQLARLSPRVAPWMPLDGWSLAGSYELVAQATGSMAAIRTRQARLAIAELEVEGPGLHVREPQAELVVSGGWDNQRRQLELPSALLTSSGVSAQATAVVCTFLPEGLPELAGTLAYQGSLDRLHQWTLDAAEPAPWHLLGQFSGKAEVRHSAATTAATFETTINDLVATHKSGRQFHEPQIRLAGRGSYDAQSRSVRIEQAQLGCGTLAVQTAGRIAFGDAQTDVELAGQIDYDMEKLSQLLSSYVGEGVSLAGRGSRPVSYRGPLALDAAQANAGLGWTRAEVYGFQVGPGELAARLSGGVLQIQPLDLAVSEGQMRLASQVRLAPEPKELYIESGRVADRVRINPRMCANALMYIAPVLAGVATAEGRFSIELDGCRIPLADPTQSELAGRMIIHSAQIGPGPLVGELAVLLGHASPAELAGESVISFRMVDGRVYHRDLELVFPDLVIRTHGSVGLDQSLDIVAEMPVPPKWRGSHELVDSALRDQLIRVPIGGTLTRPRLDRKTLEMLSQQFLDNAVRNVVEEGLNRGLERLFAPPR